MKQPKLTFILNLKKIECHIFLKIFYGNNKFEYGEYNFSLDKRETTEINIFLGSHCTFCRNNIKQTINEICDTISHEYFHHALNDINEKSFTQNQEHQIMKKLGFK